jgi:excisionase family DNA binding protein
MKQKRLTISQAAQLRGVSRSALYAAIERKTLRAHWDLGRLVVTEKDLTEWVANKGKGGRKKGQTLSAEHRANLSAARKADWARRKRSQS